MEQHAIPQQISSYEFKLVGEMTLKQFGKAAIGIILALIVNASPLFFLIKAPLAVLFAAGGLALAFVPFQDRPLETWIISFLKSIYNPTMFIYKKRADKNWLDVDLTKNLAELKKEEEEEKEIPIKEKKKVEEFIETLPSVKREPNEKKADNPNEKQTPLNLPLTGETSETVNKKKIEIVEEDWGAGNPSLGLKKEKLNATGEIVFGEIPMPTIPETPNMIVGMVTNTSGKIIEGAIVEIQDMEGNPSRVLKTNSLGQFKTSSQLANGDYLIVTETNKKEIEFDRVRLTLSGKIVPPVKIIAK
jgi:hypothetical protein